VPDSGYTGSDSFSYKATDWYSDTATVTLQINAAQHGNNSRELFARLNPASPPARPLLFEFGSGLLAFSLFTEAEKDYRAKSIRSTGTRCGSLKAGDYCLKNNSTG
jgi:hypothetical protein|tara:strand:+ start:16 stop:333 length:318 start_codon:yes stop_codon:yes gene_type:complete